MEWQPIETAPMDGTYVVLHQDGRVFRGFYAVIDFKEMRDADGRYVDQIDPDEFWMDDEGDMPEPTHWQPLPPLPPPPEQVPE